MIILGKCSEKKVGNIGRDMLTSTKFKAELIPVIKKVELVLSPLNFTRAEVELLPSSSIELEFLCSTKMLAKL